MPNFMVWLKDSVNEDAYWLCADTDADARRLVALNIEGASDASDPAKFDCVENSEKTPPFGLIYRRLYGPETISKR